MYTQPYVTVNYRKESLFAFPKVIPNKGVSFMSFSFLIFVIFSYLLIYVLSPLPCISCTMGKYICKADNFIETTDGNKGTLLRYNNVIFEIYSTIAI